MLVGVVYVYMQFMYTKNIRVSSVPSNTSCEERREAIVLTGYVIQKLYFNIKR